MVMRLDKEMVGIVFVTDYLIFFKIFGLFAKTGFYLGNEVRYNLIGG